jgi:WD40 repeat protein
MPIISIRWHPISTQNRIYLAHVNGFIRSIDPQQQQQQQQKQHESPLRSSNVYEESDEISCIDLNVDGSLLASVGRDNSIKIYNPTLTDSNKKSNSKMLKYLYSFSKQDDLISSTKDHTQLLHTNRLQCVKFSNKSSFVLLTGGWDRTVKVWDTRVGDGLVETIHGPFICGSDGIDIDVINRNNSKTILKMFLKIV